MAKRCRSAVFLLSVIAETAGTRMALGGAYLIDHIPCSLLVARNVISDEVLEAGMR